MAALAARQHGVVSRRQLLDAGVRAGVVDRRLRSGWLRPLHRGVYRVGPVAAPLAREMAAVLACGRRALVSHRSAAVLWGMAPHAAASMPVDVTLRGGDRRRPGVRIHHSRTLTDGEATRLEGIPVTTPARTLLDLAGTSGRRGVERLLTQALSRERTSPREIRAVLAHHPGHNGCRTLGALVEEGPEAPTRSAAEEHFLALVRETGLPMPRVNVRVAGHEVDFHWREEGLVVEVDGFAFHSNRGAFERDRRRDAALVAAGLRVIRVTSRQLRRERDRVLVRLAQALAVGSRTGGSALTHGSDARKPPIPRVHRR